MATNQLTTNETVKNRYSRLDHLWKWRESTGKPTVFEHVHLPDDRQEFLKPTTEMLSRELRDAPDECRGQAIAYFQVGDRAFAEGHYRDAASAYLASGAEASSLSAHLACGVAKIMVSELRAAVELFEAGRVRAQARQVPPFEAAFDINLGQVYSDLGEMERARRALEMALVLSRKMRDVSLEMLSLAQRRLCSFTRGEYGEESNNHCPSAFAHGNAPHYPPSRDPASDESSNAG